MGVMRRLAWLIGYSLVPSFLHFCSSLGGLGVIVVVVLTGLFGVFLFEHEAIFRTDFPECRLETVRVADVV